MYYDSRLYASYRRSPDLAAPGAAAILLGLGAALAGTFALVAVGLLIAANQRPAAAVKPTEYHRPEPAEIKQAEIQYGPLRRDRLNEVKGAAPDDAPKEQCPGGRCPPTAGARIVGPSYTPTYPPPAYPSPTYRPSYTPPVPIATPGPTREPGLPPVRPGERIVWVGPWRTVPTIQPPANLPPPLDPYREPNRPRLPEQIPLADDDLPTWLPRPDFAAGPRGEEKTGGYACANCKRPTVGDQWATQWTPEGTPITYLCRECWAKMSEAQRREAYHAWYTRQTGGR